MSCDSNDDELKLTREYKCLLSYIRPLIDQLDKSKDAQLCLLWLSKLEQCASWERNYRNKILSELCKQVQANCLKPPFNVSPPNGSLRNIICGDWKSQNWDIIECSEVDASTEDAMSSSSLHSFNSITNSRKHTQLSSPWKEGYATLCHSPKNKVLGKFGKESTDHSECFAIQKAYHERAHNDQMVIERYQDIIKSLVSQQLKADISPSRLKKLQSTYEVKMAELTNSLKRTQEENEILKRKMEGLSGELSKMQDLKSDNERLKKHVLEIETAKNLLEAKHKQDEEEKVLRMTNLVNKLNESERKLKGTEKRCQVFEKKLEQRSCNDESEAQASEREKKYSVKISDLERLLEEKQMEISSLKQQMTDKYAQFEHEVFQLKQELSENSNLDTDKRKIKILKIKAKKLEKIQEHMSVLFQSQLQQILAKKDFYIASLEMQLKMNSPNCGGNFGSDFNYTLSQKVSSLEAQYRKLLEDSEKQSLKRRQLDLQKIHSLEKQLLLYGGLAEETEPNSDQLKTDSFTSASGLEDEFKDDRNLIDPR